MIAYWKSPSEIVDGIYIPKFYDPSIDGLLEELQETHNLLTIRTLVSDKSLEVETGHEIGKAAYGTGNTPFVRTSDISNWEIKSAPKQGVSEEIYAEYADKQNVKAHDILMVRDGTYLIGTNCFITKLDAKLVYQSHILKFRILRADRIDPHLFFLALNSSIVRKQIRSIQFTADTIDTIGNRYLDVVIPIPKDSQRNSVLIEGAKKALENRVRGKAFIKQAPALLEEILRTGCGTAIEEFSELDLEADDLDLKQDTVTDEFGHFETFWMSKAAITGRIYLPKYYDPEIADELGALRAHCELRKISELIHDKRLSIKTGDEIGKMAYGTGDIPFLRTSDFANWEIKHDPKQGVSEEIYRSFAEKQDLRAEDVLLVRDGTYLVGSSCIVTEGDTKALYCGGLIKIRSEVPDDMDGYLLLGLLNSYIVKRQIRTKQFTRDVIDTLGQRLSEVVLPIPKSAQLRAQISSIVKNVIDTRMKARRDIRRLSKDLQILSGSTDV